MKAGLPKNGMTFVDSAITQRGALRIGEIQFKGSDGLTRAYYHIPDPRPRLRIGGKLVSSYSIITYVHNNRLRAKAETVVDSFKLTD